MSKIKKNYVKKMVKMFRNNKIVATEENATAFSDAIAEVVSYFSDEEIKTITAQKYFSAVIAGEPITLAQNIEMVEALEPQLVKRNLISQLKISQFIQANPTAFEQVV